MSLEDEARSGRPLAMDTTDKEMCKKVRDLVYSDRGIQVEEIVQALGILQLVAFQQSYMIVKYAQANRLLGPQIP